MSMWNLEKSMERAKAEYQPPTGTKADQIRELLKRCEEIDERCRENALEAEAEGDTEACWLAMATRAENKRFKERLERALLK